MNRHFLQLLLFALAAFLIDATPASSDENVAAKAQPAPNVLFIAIDDLNHYALGLRPDSRAHTPNLERLATRGMLFTNACVTNSICAPSRAVILTGKHSHLNGFLRNGNRFDGHQTTFPPLMKAAGYQTALVGSPLVKNSKLVATEA